MVADINYIFSDVNLYMLLFMYYRNETNNCSNVTKNANNIKENELLKF